MAKWLYFIVILLRSFRKTFGAFFYSLNVSFSFFKVANDQRPAADSELIIACLINLDMINISIESFKLVLNEIKRIENKNYFIIIIIRRCIY